MIIGIPKEIMHDEGRASAIPETVKLMVAAGDTVLVEKGAGEGSFYFDEQYTEVGAKIVDEAKDVYAQADVILKVKEPLFNEKYGCSEIDLMHKGQYLITFIHPASPVNHEMVKKMAEKGVIGLTLDGVPRISRAQNMDALSSMSTCAGYKGLLMAANSIPAFMTPIFCAVGAIKPANVLVIGTGVAGLRALATAKQLGAITHATDIRPAALENAKSMGAKIIDLGVPAELAMGEGGYAKHLSEDWLAKEHEILAKVLPEMDLVFCSALVPGKLAPIIITDDMLKLMKPGAALVDISIDQGGNCTETPRGSIESKYGVTLFGVKNIPGLLPKSSTWMFSHNIYNLLKYLEKDGQIVLDMNDEIIRGIITTKDGEILHAGAREAMGL